MFNTIPHVHLIHIMASKRESRTKVDSFGYPGIVRLQRSLDKFGTSPGDAPGRRGGYLYYFARTGFDAYVERFPEIFAGEIGNVLLESDAIRSTNNPTPSAQTKLMMKSPPLVTT